MGSATVLDLDFAARALLTDRPAANAAIAHVAIDSRECVPGTLFVALEGARADGHDFARQAVERGAVAVLGKRIPPGVGAPVFVVKEPVAALRALAHAWRRSLSCMTVAIAGSVGKTTTKELVAALLRGRYGADRVLATLGNQNGFLGVPLTVLRMRPEHAVAVVEIGIDELGAMAVHLDTAMPHHAIATAVGPEHLEQLGTLEAVAHEESQVLSYAASRGGSAFYPQDDPWLAAAAQPLGPRALAYALASGAHPTSDAAFRGAYDPASQTLAVLHPFSATFAVPLVGAHNAKNLLGAAAIAHVLGLSAEEMARGLATFAPQPGRCRLERLPSGTTVLCDYYNASPPSVEAALMALAQLPVERRLVCLGDMLELGHGEEALHRSLASAVERANTAGVWLYGPRMRWLAAELLARGAASPVAHFDDLTSLVASLAPALGPRDGLLLKGSRSMALERVWQMLLARSAVA